MRILIVEDDDTQRILLRRIIEKLLCCNVIEAKNGLEGLTKIENESPDAIFLDLWMPLMNGIEVLQKITHTMNKNSVPVVVTSAISDKEIVARVISLGVTDYLLKPFTNKQVNERVIKIQKLISAKVPAVS